MEASCVKADGGVVEDCMTGEAENARERVGETETD